MYKKFYVLMIVFAMVSTLPAQGRKIHWKKKHSRVQAPIELFHSTQSVNLPTTEVLKKGEFEYEISHRFLPPLNTQGAFGGIDGPGQIRMALAYGLSNRMMLTLGRSNRLDNVDIRLKYKALQFAHKIFPLTIALRAGTGWNTEVANREAANADNFQYYGQVIVNTLIAKKLGIGLVPSYLYNSHIYCVNKQYSFTLGSYIQYYVSSMWSLLLEMNHTVMGFRDRYNSIAMGIELETGGHFFKIFVTNNAALNPSQYLAGADLGFFSKDWRLGFNITRILKF